MSSKNNRVKQTKCHRNHAKYENTSYDAYEYVDIKQINTKGNTGIWAPPGVFWVLHIEGFSPSRTGRYRITSCRTIEMHAALCCPCAGLRFDVSLSGSLFTHRVRWRGARAGRMLSVVGGRDEGSLARKRKLQRCVLSVCPTVARITEDRYRHAAHIQATIFPFGVEFVIFSKQMHYFEVHIMT